MRDLSASFAAALEQPIVYPIYFVEAEFATGTLNLWTGFGERQWNGKTWSGIGWILGISEVEETAEVKATSLTVGMPSNPELNSVALAQLRRNKPMTIWQGLLTPAATIGDPETGETIGEADIVYRIGDSGTGERIGDPATLETVGDPGTGEEIGEYPGDYWLGDPATDEEIGERIPAFELGEPGGLIETPYCVFKGLCDVGEIDIDPKKPALRIRYKSRIADLERARERRMTHEDQQIEFPGDMFYQYTGALSDAVINWGGNGNG